MSAARPAFTLAACLLVAGCVVPPKVAPAEKPVERRIDLGLGKDPAPVEAAWWTTYQDPQLNELLNAALAANPTLAEAMARLHQAQAILDATRAELWPYISYDASASRERISAKDAIPSQYDGANTWRSREGLNFSWELDFWGRQASLVRQVKDEAGAIALDEAAARLAIISAVVRAYIDLERSYELVEVARREEQQRQQILDITQHRFTAGLDTSVELKQAAGAVPEARVERLSDEAAIERDVHLLAALSGRGADMYAEIRRPHLQPEAVLSLPSTLPADLLARRPDVLAARRRIGAAQGGLAAAKADFYPNIDLLAFAGTVAVGPLDTMFHGHAAAWGVGPAVHLPIFDAGRLRANYRAKAADVDIAARVYDETVLGAVRETADQLSDIRSLNASLVEQEQSLDDAETAFHLATERYKSGLTTYLTVLSTETQVLNARRQHVDLEASRASARVTLLVDVGGDFEPDASEAAQGAGR
jgi:NodT family efflux transporter outer membrane factor (OMF) lipoprotein